MTVRPAALADGPAIERIVRGLPDFFTPDVPDTVAADLATHQSWVVVDGEEAVGFAVVDRRSAKAVELVWAAVADDRRGQGVAPGSSRPC